MAESVSVTGFEEIADGTVSKIVHNIQANGELGVRLALKVSTSVLLTGGGVFLLSVFARTRTCAQRMQRMQRGLHWVLARWIRRTNRAYLGAYL